METFINSHKMLKFYLYHLMRYGKLRNIFAVLKNSKKINFYYAS